MTSTVIAVALTALYLADVLWHRQCQTRRPRRLAKALVILIAYPVAGMAVDAGLLVLIGSFLVGHLYRPGPGVGERWDTRRYRRAASLDEQPLRNDRPRVDDAEAAAKTRALQAAARIAEAKSAEAEARARRAAALARAAEIKAATARAEAEERARVGKEIDEAYAAQAAAEGSDANTATDTTDF